MCRVKSLAVRQQGHEFVLIPLREKRKTVQCCYLFFLSLEMCSIVAFLHD